MDSPKLTAYFLSSTKLEKWWLWMVKPSRSVMREIELRLIDFEVLEKEKIDVSMLVDEDDDGKVVWFIKSPSIMVYGTNYGVVKGCTHYLVMCDNFVSLLYFDVQERLGAYIDLFDFYDVFENEEAKQKYLKIYPVLGALIDFLRKLADEEGRMYDADLELRASMAEVYFAGRVNVKGLRGWNIAKRVGDLVDALLGVYYKTERWRRYEVPKIYEEALKEAEKAMLEYSKKTA